MSNDKHTPGPFMRYGVMVRDTVETVGGMFCIRPGKMIVNHAGRTVPQHGDTIAYAYSRADADLFAAAPDMLAALRWAVGMAEEAIMCRELDPEEDDTPEVIAMHRAALDSARAAIAKAEGRA